MIDFILVQTKQNQITYAGYSQGGTVIFILLSERPEYNNKIATVHAMAAAVYFIDLSPIYIPALLNIDTIQVQ